MSTTHEQKTTHPDAAIKRLDLPLCRLPLRTEDIEWMQKNRLLRYLLLCTHPQILDYYLQIALKCMNEGGSQDFDTTSGFRAQIGDNNTVRKRFVLLVALNKSNDFFYWMCQHSQADSVNTAMFCSLLEDHFRLFIEHTNRTGHPAKSKEEVLYPTLYDFMDAMTSLFFRM
jgi:hypothetical protein